MATKTQFAQIQREDLRWRILSTLEAGRPGAVSEDLVFRIAKDVGLNIAQPDVRSEMSWLEDLHLVSVTERGRTWMARILPTGVNVVEYTVEAPVGIARPKKY